MQDLNTPFPINLLNLNSPEVQRRAQRLKRKRAARFSLTDKGRQAIRQLRSRG